MSGVSDTVLKTLKRSKRSVEQLTHRSIGQSHIALARARRRVARSGDNEPRFLSPDETAALKFFQFNCGNAEFFFKNKPAMDIRVMDTPHYLVAKSLVADTPSRGAAQLAYFDYLRHSWPSRGLDTDHQLLDKRYTSFVELVEQTTETADLDEPATLTRFRRDGDLFVVDGNHRCAIAAARGQEMPVRILDFSTAFDKFMRVDEFYGTGNRRMPYQSIYVDRSVVREGRRRDIYKRLAMLPPGLIAGRSIVDVGSNIGMNAIAAAQLGASTVVGLELSRSLVNHATRFAIFQGAYPAVRFEEFNVSTDQLTDDRKFDVGFMFSVHDHVGNPPMLASIARDHVREAIVFEGHPGARIDNYAEFIDKAAITNIERVGDLASSVFDIRPTRPLWILSR